MNLGDNVDNNLLHLKWTVEKRIIARPHASCPPNNLDESTEGCSHQQIPQTVPDSLDCVGHCHGIRGRWSETESTSLTGRDGEQHKECGSHIPRGYIVVCRIRDGNAVNCSLAGQSQRDGWMNRLGHTKTRISHVLSRDWRLLVWKTGWLPIWLSQSL